MIFSIQVAGVLSALQLAAAQYSWKLNMTPRRQWEENLGYCGEVSTVHALLNFGGYMSQYDMRIAAVQKQFLVQTTSEYLIAVNGPHCADQIKLNYQEWNP